MVSADVASYEAEIIRITGRGPRPDGSPPLSYVRVPSEVDGTYPGAVHQTVSGSYGTCDQVCSSAAGEGSLVAWVYPTLPALGRWQGILTWLGQDGQRALGLGLDGDGYLALCYRHADGGAGLLRGPGPLEAGRWYYVAASASPARGQLALLCRERARTDLEAAVVTGSADVAAAALGTRAHIAALGTGPLEPGTLTSVVDGSYNGKVDRPRLLPQALEPAGLAGLADGAVTTVPVTTVRSPPLPT